MNMRQILLAVLFGALVLTPPLIAGKRLQSAKAQKQASQMFLESTHRDAREILALRATEQRVAVQKRPQEHVLAQVNAVLAEAGIPSRKLQGIRPEADQALPTSPGSSGGANYRRQSVSIGFQQMTAPELGRFLSLWRQDESIWTPARIELTKHRGRAADDDLYDITLVISAVYLADA